MVYFFAAASIHPQSAHDCGVDGFIILLLLRQTKIFGIRERQKTEYYCYICYRIGIKCAGGKNSKKQKKKLNENRAPTTTKNNKRIYCWINNIK